MLIVTPPLFSATLYAGGGEPPTLQDGNSPKFSNLQEQSFPPSFVKLLACLCVVEFLPTEKKFPHSPSPMTRIIDERERGSTSFLSLGLGQKRMWIHRRSFPSIPFHRRRRRRMTATTPLEPTRSSPSPQTAQSATPPQRPT